MAKSGHAERDLIQRFLESLREFLDVDAKFGPVERERESEDPDRGCDARVDMHLADQSIVLLIKVRKAVSEGRSPVAPAPPGVGLQSRTSAGS
jgi:hypothetical protein